MRDTETVRPTSPRTRSQAGREGTARATGRNPARKRPGCRFKFMTRSFRAPPPQGRGGPGDPKVEPRGVPGEGGGAGRGGAGRGGAAPSLVRAQTRRGTDRRHLAWVRARDSCRRKLFNQRKLSPCLVSPPLAVAGHKKFVLPAVVGPPHILQIGRIEVAEERQPIHRLSQTSSTHGRVCDTLWNEHRRPAHGTGCGWDGREVKGRSCIRQSRRRQ